MSNPFIGEIRIVGFPFPPRGWAQCNGQTILIRQNSALFSILGTVYGGDGTNTFQLPNLNDRAAMNFGDGPGLSPRVLGETDGSAGVTLTIDQIPAHTHTYFGANPGDPSEQTDTPSNQTYLSFSNPQEAYADTTNQVVSFAPIALEPAGSTIPHNNLQPYLMLNFCIALSGIFPSRN